MRLGQLSEWNVSESKAEVPPGYAVQAERAVCKWSLFGQAWSQGLPVTGRVKARFPDLHGHGERTKAPMPQAQGCAEDAHEVHASERNHERTSQDPGASFACRWM